MWGGVERYKAVLSRRGQDRVRRRQTGVVHLQAKGHQGLWAAKKKKLGERQRISSSEPMGGTNPVDTLISDFYFPEL